jgi:glycosidase
MNPWPKHPVIYEINTWVWLNELSQKYGKPITLAAVPSAEWDGLSSFGADAVWLMGVWERSPAGKAIANGNAELLADFRRALPDFQLDDNVGSPYCVRRYTVDGHLGGRDGLAAARRELARRGLRLLLDFVPNHVAPDHQWALDHPGYLVQGNADDAEIDPASFIAIGGKVFACGRDPFFPAWPDVLQLNAFNPNLRQAVVETLADIADQSDGVRCDMAMLMLNQVFKRTWGHRAGRRPASEYWVDVISAVKKTHPDFLFMAEAYWDLEWELQQQGFDYCYDKRLYDRLERDSAENVRLHLCADLAYQGKLVRFIENHDEPRAAAAFPGERLRAAAVASLTLPGARLLHEGQFEGRHVRLPVFLKRRPVETPDEELTKFYRRLLEVVRGDTLKTGGWRLCECSGWPDNTSWRNLVAWCWSRGAERCLIVVNLSAGPAQARLHFPWDAAGGTGIILKDVFSSSTYTREQTETVESGLFVDLPAWGYHVFTIGAHGTA